MAVAREAEPVGSLHEVEEAGLDREDLLGIYRTMLVTRGIEERGHILYRQGKIPGSFYTGRGNEAAAIGVATAMGPDDIGTPLHRDMGVHITRGVEPWRIFAQYMGRADGPTRARGGGGPTLLECLTLRMEGHAVHDDAFYVPKMMFEKWAESDPLERFRTWLREHADMTDDEEGEIAGGVKKLLNDALRRAEESP